MFERFKMQWISLLKKYRKPNSFTMFLPKYRERYIYIERSIVSPLVTHFAAKPGAVASRSQALSMPHKEHLSPRALRAMTLGLEIAGLTHWKGVIYPREMWKTSMVRFRSLILHDITWGCLTKWNPKPPWHIITHWNSKFGVRPILRQTWRWRYGHPSHHGNLHLYSPDIHRIDNIPPFGEKNNGTCRRSGSTPLHGTRQISATAAYLWTHLGRTEAPTTCGHIMALLSYLPLSQWKAPGTMAVQR